MSEATKLEWVIAVSFFASIIVVLIWFCFVYWLACKEQEHRLKTWAESKRRILPGGSDK